MPIISCPSCKARFKVPIQTVGKTLKCPRCKEKFQAVALHSTTRKDHGSKPIVYAAIVVGAVLVTILIYALAGRDSGEEPAEVNAGADSSRQAKPTAPVKLSTPQEMLEARATNILEAFRDQGNPMLPGWIDFARMHEDRIAQGLEDRSWATLADEEKYARQNQYLDLLLGDAATREFTRLCTVESVDCAKMGSGKGKVDALLKNALKDTTQKLVMFFATSAGAWKLYRLERGEIEGLPEKPEIPEKPDAIARAGRQRNPEGEVVEVELIEDTPRAVTSNIQRALDKLTDLSLTTEAGKARAELVKAGKPAIPHLLNAMVPLDLQSEKDVQVAMRISAALTELTGQDYPIVPGMNAGSMVGEGARENQSMRARWFGWWRDNKSTFTGPPQADFGPEDDLPESVKKKTRRRGG